MVWGVGVGGGGGGGVKRNTFSCKTILSHFMFSPRFMLAGDLERPSCLVLSWGGIDLAIFGRKTLSCKY